MSSPILDSAMTYTTYVAMEAGNAMEAAFASAKTGDHEGALSLAQEAVAKALLAKKALTTVLRAAPSSDVETSRLVLGHVEDARLFAKAAMDVVRGAMHCASDKTNSPAGKKSAETLAFLMVTAAALLEIKRGGMIESLLRKAVLASERAVLAAEDAAKAGGGDAVYSGDAKAAKDTAVEIARRALWAVRDAQKRRGS